MALIYCFRGLSRESRCKTEREEDTVIHNEHYKGEGLIAPAKELDIAQFSTPVSLLCDTFCAVGVASFTYPAPFICLWARGVGQWST